MRAWILICLLGGLAAAGSPGLRARLNAIEKHVRSGERAQALKSLRVLVNEHPRAVEAHVLYQDLMTASGRRDELARAYRDRHKELNTAESHFLYARLLQGRRAVSELRRVTKRDGTVSRYWVEYALALRKTRRTKDAIKAARRSVELDRNSSRAREVLGWTLERAKKDKSKEAEQCYRDAIRLRNENVRARFKLAHLLVRTRRGTEALSVLSDAAELAPGEPKVAINKGLVLAAMKRPEEAAQAYKDAVDKAPKDAFVLVLLAEAYAELSQWKLARSAVERALGIDEKLAVAHAAHGYVAWRQGELDEALRAYKTAARLDTTNARYLYYLARVCEQRGKFAEAERHMRKAVFRAPDAAVYRVALGRTLERMGKLKEALNAYREATRRAATDPVSWTRYAHVAADLRKFKVAEKAFLQALKLEPKDIGLMLSLGVVYEMGLRKPDKALKWYQAYVAGGGTDPRVKDWIKALK